MTFFSFFQKQRDKKTHTCHSQINNLHVWEIQCHNDIHQKVYKVEIINSCLSIYINSLRQWIYPNNSCTDSSNWFSFQQTETCVHIGDNIWQLQSFFSHSPCIKERFFYINHSTAMFWGIASTSMPELWSDAYTFIIYIHKMS